MKLVYGSVQDTQGKHGEDHVNKTKDGGFIVKRFHPDDKGSDTGIQNNFTPFGSNRMRVRNGELKGWWVGLKIFKENPEPGKPALAQLVLVKDKKDAAIISHDDPTDISPE